MKHVITYTKTFEVETENGSIQDAKDFVTNFMTNDDGPGDDYFEGVDFDMIGDRCEHIPPQITTLGIVVYDSTNNSMLELTVDVPFNEPDDLMHAAHSIHAAIHKEFPEVKLA